MHASSSSNFAKVVLVALALWRTWASGAYNVVCYKIARVQQRKCSPLMASLIVAAARSWLCQ
jgi:hypothetical protein